MVFQEQASAAKEQLKAETARMKREQGEAVKVHQQRSDKKLAEQSVLK